MRKTTEELRKEAGIKLATAQPGTVGDYFWCGQKELETFRRLVIENEREAQANGSAAADLATTFRRPKLTPGDCCTAARICNTYDSL